MSSAFGHNFVLVSKTRQLLPSPPFVGGPWVHMATVVRGFKEYCAFVHQPTNKLYIECVDPSDPNLFVSIQDDVEWADLYRFLLDQGAISTGRDQVFEVGEAGLPGWNMND